MMGIVLRRVEVSVHTACRTEVENSFSVWHAPKRPKEPLDDTAPLKNSVLRHELAICHSAPALTSFLANGFGIA
jgi:hypothetical protein